MINTKKTVIVTGGSRLIGTDLVTASLDRDYNVVANSRSISKSPSKQAYPGWAAAFGAHPIA